MGMRQTHRLVQKQHQTVEIDPDKYIWCELGWAKTGIKNDEGYSHEHLSIGTEKESVSSQRGFRINIVQIIEKFYYSNSTDPHYEEEQYFDWSGNIVDYIDEKRRKQWH